MKKILFTAIASIVGVLCFAQVEKGNWFVNSNFSLSYASQKLSPEYDGESTEDINITTFTFNPNVNYFIVDNLAIGLGFEYTNIEVEEQKQYTFAIMPTAKYFFKQDKLAPFIGLGAGYIGLGGKDDASKYNGFAMKGEGGLAYFITENVAANAVVNYTWSKMSNKEDSKLKANSNKIGVGLGFSIFF